MRRAQVVGGMVGHAFAADRVRGVRIVVGCVLQGMAQPGLLHEQQHQRQRNPTGGCQQLQLASDWLGHFGKPTLGVGAEVVIFDFSWCKCPSMGN